MIKKIMLLASFLCYQSTMQSVHFSSYIDHKNELNQTVTINVMLDENETIFSDTVHTSIDSPHFTFDESIINISPIKKYIPEFKQKKMVYDQDFTITVNVDCSEQKHVSQGTLHISYLSSNNNTILDEKVALYCNPKNNLEQQALDSSNLSPMPAPVESKIDEKNNSFVSTIQDLVEHTKAPWAQILFALLLGLLLSLTPCIYPMIPITIGILHSHGKKSLLQNFLGSMSYAFGIATTFACLGLLATVAGSSFGSLLSNPLFVMFLVIFIGYMSLTMIGILDMYIPSIMKAEIKFYKNLGPYLAAYLFGAISGTIASPCVSPGLALLLSIVATMGNKILGFFLLFAFGIGLSTPLIIIGTFSNSLYMLPKSGMWMLEIKKILGFFMLATCFYYLSNILPISIVYWLFTGFTFFMAMFYLMGTDKDSNVSFKTLHSVIGIIMISLTILMATKSYEKTFYSTPLVEIGTSVEWQDNYEVACEHAINNNNLLLIDFWANHCTICKAIDKKVFQNSKFNNILKDSITFLKIDATHNSNADYTLLKNLYKVYAQPTILLIDPKTQTVLKKWSSEPYGMTIEEFAQEIKNIQK